MRGISPIVAVVLLIGITVIAGVGIYFWLETYTSKPATPSMPGMFIVNPIGQGKILIANLGNEPLNVSALKVSDANVNISCENSTIGPGEQVACNVYGHPSSKQILIYGNNVGSVALQVSSTNETVKPWSPTLGTYTYRQEIDVGSVNGSSESDYQIRIELNDSNVGPHFNWSDKGLRFTELKDGKEVALPYWIEYWNATNHSAVVWVKADAPATLYMYYNAGRPSESQASSVFIDDIPGLVGFWPFDEGQGDVVHDESGYGNDGTIKGMYTLDFNENHTGDYVDCGNNSILNITQNISLTAWIKQGDYGLDYEIPVSKFYSYFLGARNADDHRPTFGLFFSDGSSHYLKGSILPDSWLHKWHFLVGTYDGHTMKLYIDGRLNASYSISKTIKPTQYSVKIGEWAHSDWFSGRIAEVRIYNRTLNDTEIQKLYSLGPGADYAKDGLVLWLNFGKKNANDQSGNGNDGTIYGSPQWVVDGPYSGWTSTSNGRYIRFDGIDDGVTVPYSEIGELKLPYTIIGKFRVNSNKVNNLWTKKLDSAVYEYQAYAYWQNNWISTSAWMNKTSRAYSFSGGNIKVGNIFTVAVASNTTIAKMYVNGELVGSDAVSGQVGQGETDLQIGWQGSNSWYLNGSVYYFLIMNKTLNANKIQEINDNYAFATPHYNGHLLVRKGYELPSVSVKEEETL